MLTSIDILATQTDVLDRTSGLFPSFSVNNFNFLTFLTEFLHTAPLNAGLAGDKQLMLNQKLVLVHTQLTLHSVHYSNNNTVIFISDTSGHVCVLMVGLVFNHHIF